MNKVYMVSWFNVELEDRAVVGIFSTMDKALDYVKAKGGTFYGIDPNDHFYIVEDGDSFTVREVIVDAKAH